MESYTMNIGEVLEPGEIRMSYLEPGEIPLQEALIDGAIISQDMYILPNSPSNTWGSKDEFVLPDSPDIWQQHCEISQHCDSEDMTENEISQHCNSEDMSENEIAQPSNSKDMTENEIMQHCNSEDMVDNEISQHSNSEDMIQNEISQYSNSENITENEIMQHFKQEKIDIDEDEFMSETWQPCSELDLKEEPLSPSFLESPVDQNEFSDISPLDQQIFHKCPGDVQFLAPCSVILDRMDLPRYELKQKLEWQLKDFECKQRTSKFLLDEASVATSLTMQRELLQLKMKLNLETIRKDLSNLPSKVNIRNIKSVRENLSKQCSEVNTKKIHRYKPYSKSKPSNKCPEVQTPFKATRNDNNIAFKSSFIHKVSISNKISLVKEPVIKNKSKVIKKNIAKTLSKEEKLAINKQKCEQNKYIFVKEKMYKYLPCFLEEHNYFNDIPKITLPSFMEMKYECPYCTNQYFGIIKVQQHCKYLHNEIVDFNDIISLTGIMYKCNVCAFSGESILKIERHRYIAHKQYRVTARERKTMHVVRDPDRFTIILKENPPICDGKVLEVKKVQNFNDKLKNISFGNGNPVSKIKKKGNSIENHEIQILCDNLEPKEKKSNKIPEKSSFRIINSVSLLQQFKKSIKKRENKILCDNLGSKVNKSSELPEKTPLSTENTESALQTVQNLITIHTKKKLCDGLESKVKSCGKLPKKNSFSIGLVSTLKPVHSNKLSDNPLLLCDGLVPKMQDSSETISVKPVSEFLGSKDQSCSITHENSITEFENIRKIKSKEPNETAPQNVSFDIPSCSYKASTFDLLQRDLDLLLSRVESSEIQDCAGSLNETQNTVEMSCKNDLPPFKSNSETDLKNALPISKISQEICLEQSIPPSEIVSETYLEKESPVLITIPETDLKNSSSLPEMLLESSLDSLLSSFETISETQLKHSLPPPVETSPETNLKNEPPICIKIPETQFKNSFLSSVEIIPETSVENSLSETISENILPDYMVDLFPTYKSGLQVTNKLSSEIGMDKLMRLKDENKRMPIINKSKKCTKFECGCVFQTVPCGQKCEYELVKDKFHLFHNVPRREFLCKFCSYKCYDISYLVEHNKIIHNINVTNEQNGNKYENVITNDQEDIDISKIFTEPISNESCNGNSSKNIAKPVSHVKNQLYCPIILKSRNILKNHEINKKNEITSNSLNVNAILIENNFENKNSALIYETKSVNSCNKIELYCQICLRKFNNLNLLIIHSKLHVFYNGVHSICKLCNRFFTNYESKNCEKCKLLETIVKYDNIVSYQCTICQTSFLNAAHFYIHQFNHYYILHRFLVDYECCGYVFNNRTNFLNHINTMHFKNIELDCKLCFMLCKNKIELAKHVIKYHGNVMIFCKNSNKEFNIPYYSNIHSKKCYIDIIEMKSKLSTIKSKNYKYHCLKCYNFYYNAYEFEAHDLKYHDCKYYYCNFCPAVTNHKKVLKSHIMSHLKSEKRY